MFAEELAADRIPSVDAIRAQLHVGQPRAQRVRDYLTGLAEAAAFPELLTAWRVIEKQPGPVRQGRCLCPSRDAEFREDVGNVNANRLGADE